MRTVTVSHNWYSFPWCSGIAVPTVFGALSDVSCRDQGRACQAWLGLVGMEVGLGHSLTVCALRNCCDMVSTGLSGRVLVDATIGATASSDVDHDTQPAH